MGPGIKVAYSDRIVATSGCSTSPSAEKPRQVAEAIAALPYVTFVEPTPVHKEDFYLCHDKTYVDDVLALKRPNGFGTLSTSVVESLPYTTGAMLTAAKAATKEAPAVALVSGFHHAGYSGFESFGYFCTFNGLLITTAKLLEAGVHKVAIVDMDMHWGNGTADILTNPSWTSKWGSGPRKGNRVKHITFGERFDRKEQAKEYLDYIDIAGDSLASFKPSIILFQAGADVHVDDPFGGILTTPMIKERDRRMFRIAKNLGIPIAWNLAGGYQRDANGGISKVLEIHMNTFEAARDVYLS